MQFLSYFKLTVNNGYDSDASDASNSVVVNFPPDAPVITNVSYNQGSLNVYFTQNNNGLGTPITDYIYSLDNGVTYTSSSIATSPLKIPSLKSGIRHQIVLKAYNTLDSDPSNTYNFTYYVKLGKTL